MWSSSALEEEMISSSTEDKPGITCGMTTASGSRDQCPNEHKLGVTRDKAPASETRHSGETSCKDNDSGVKETLKRMSGRVPQSVVMGVYMDLAEVKDWWDVQAHFCEALQMVVLSGRPSRHEATQVILPVCPGENLSIEKMREFMQATAGLDISDHRDSGLVLAFTEMDGTIVHYKITDGLVPPEPPHLIAEKRARKNREFHKRKLRNREFILFRN